MGHAQRCNESPAEYVCSCLSGYFAYPNMSSDRDSPLIAGRNQNLRKASSYLSIPWSESAFRRPPSRDTSSPPTYTAGPKPRYSGVTFKSTATSIPIASGSKSVSTQSPSRNLAQLGQVSAIIIIII